MRTVWKFPAPAPGRNMQIDVPGFPRPLAMGKQGDEYVWWGEVDDEDGLRPVELLTLGTGWEVPRDAAHIDTIQEGAFVWHLYVRVLPK